MKNGLKLLFLGISYGNDALRYFPQMAKEAGYDCLTLGRIGNSNTSIRDQLDSIYSGKPTPDLKQAHVYSPKGTRELSGDYREIIRTEEWEHIIFYQGPKHIGMPWALEPCGELAEELRRFCTNKAVRISYFMPWAHNVEDTEELYRTVAAATKKHAGEASEIDAVIPAGTVIQSLRRMGYTNVELTRDWGHMNYGLGRYAVGLTFACSILNKMPEDLSYLPRLCDVGEDERKCFREIGEKDAERVKSAVLAALKHPYEPIKQTI